MGFLGTNAGVLSDFSLVLEVALLVIVTMGWILSRTKRQRPHHTVMLLATVINILFVLSYMVKSLVEGSTSYTGDSRGLYIAVVAVHGLVSVVVLVMAIVVTVAAIRWRDPADDAKTRLLEDKKGLHKRLGTILALLWYVSVVTGIVVYAMLYL